MCNLNSNILRIDFNLPTFMIFSNSLRPDDFHIECQDKVIIIGCPKKNYAPRNVVVTTWFKTSVFAFPIVFRANFWHTFCQHICKLVREKYTKKLHYLWRYRPSISKVPKSKRTTKTQLTSFFEPILIMP